MAWYYILGLIVAGLLCLLVITCAVGAYVGKVSKDQKVQSDKLKKDELRIIQNAVEGSVGISNLEFALITYGEDDIPIISLITSPLKESDTLSEEALNTVVEQIKNRLSIFLPSLGFVVRIVKTPEGSTPEQMFENIANIRIMAPLAVPRPLI